MDHLLDSQAGVVTRAQALQYLSDKAIRQRVATARWQQPHRSVFVTHNGPLGPVEKRWIALLTVGNDGLLGGVTALQAAGLSGHDDEPVHVLVPARHQPSRSPAGVAVHRTTVLPARDVVAADRPPRTSTARAVVDAAQWADGDDRARALVAAAFDQRLVIAQDVDDVLSRLPRARRRRLVMAAVRDAEYGEQSLDDVNFGRFCGSHRLPRPSPQVVRRDAAGRPRYLAMRFDQWRIHVEIHARPPSSREQAWEDTHRQNELRIAGDRVLLFPAGFVRHRPGTVVAQVRAALLTAGWQPPD